MKSAFAKIKEDKNEKYNLNNYYVIYDNLSICENKKIQLHNYRIK